MVTHVMQRNNAVGDAGAIGLGEGLKSNTSLQTQMSASALVLDHPAVGTRTRAASAMRTW